MICSVTAARRHRTPNGVEKGSTAARSDRSSCSIKVSSAEPRPVWTPPGRLGARVPCATGQSPGVVVHGLLMASWLVQAAARHAEGPHPLAEMRLRFRKPLRPATAAEITGTAGTDGGLELRLSTAGDTLVTASARVTA